MQRNGSPPPLGSTFLHSCPLLSVYLKPGPRLFLFVPLRPPFGAFSVISHPFSMSPSLSLSLASPTSFLFLQSSPSSLSCLLQQKIQRRHHECVFVHAAVRWICRQTLHAREQIKKYFKKTITQACFVKCSDHNADCWRLHHSHANIPP